MSRVILKFSGEALKSNDEIVSKDKLQIIYKLVKLLIEDNHQVGIVIGGGNFFRGREHKDMQKVTADTIGMLGTVMNALYLKDYLFQREMKAIVSTPFSFPDLINNYTTDVLKNLYEDKNIIIFGGGIGKSGYSTDSGVIRASEILGSDLIIKLTNVDGVYDKDPKESLDAKKYNYITYNEVLDKKLEIMDAYAIQKCQDLNIKILVMHFLDYSKILDYFIGKPLGTVIGK